MHNKIKDEILKHITDETCNDVLKRTFIISALEHYSELIMENGRPESHGNGIVSDILWYDIASYFNNLFQKD
jgi:hypothetical protein